MHDDAPDPRDVGDRIERLLDDLHRGSIRRAYGAVEDLVRLLTDLYGGGLARVVDLARRRRLRSCSTASPPTSWSPAC